MPLLFIDWRWRRGILPTHTRTPRGWPGKAAVFCSMSMTVTVSSSLALLLQRIFFIYRLPFKFFFFLQNAMGWKLLAYLSFFVTCRTLSVGSYQIPLGPLIGRPFGSLFQMRTGPDGPFLIEDQSKASSDSQRKLTPLSL